KPSRPFSTSSGAPPGGSCRSPSMTTTAFPRACSRPAVIAIWWPKLRDSRSARKRASSSCSLRITSTEPSVDPSSTRMTSASPSSRSMTARSREWSAGSVSRSSSTGTTIEYAGDTVWSVVLRTRLVPGCCSDGGATSSGADHRSSETRQAVQHARAVAGGEHSGVAEAEVRVARPRSDRGLRVEDEVEVESGGWRYGPWLVAATFGLIVVATAAYFLRITGGSWFFVDEWSMALQLERPGGIIEPYNGHLSVSILSLYRVLLELFGFSYLPYRGAGGVALVGVPVALCL